MTRDELVVRLTEHLAPSAAKFGATVTLRLGTCYNPGTDTPDVDVIFVQVAHPVVGSSPEQPILDEIAKALMNRSPERIDALIALNMHYITSNDLAALRARAGLPLPPRELLS